jgi:hypothetical protein
MPLTVAQDAANKRMKQVEAEVCAFLDEQVKLGADAQCVAKAKTDMQSARLFANEGICGPLSKYKPDEEPKTEAQ